jgi:hypothetical protein
MPDPTRDYAAESAACDAAYMSDARDQAARVPHTDPDRLPVPSPDSTNSEPKDPTMKRIIFRTLGVLAFLALAVHLTSALLGCTATLGSDGKTHYEFNAAATTQALSQPIVRDVAHTIPFGLGDLGLDVALAVLGTYSLKKAGNGVPPDVMKHTVETLGARAGGVVAELITPAPKPAEVPAAPTK